MRKHEIKIHFDLSEENLPGKLLAAGKNLDFISRMEGLDEIFIEGDNITFVAYARDTFIDKYKFKNNDLVPFGED